MFQDHDLRGVKARHCNQAAVWKVFPKRAIRLPNMCKFLCKFQYLDPERPSGPRHVFCSIPLRRSWEGASRRRRKPMRLTLTPCTLTLMVVLQLQAAGAFADELPGTVAPRDRVVPTTLRAVHMRDLASREEPAAEPPSRERWLDHFGTTK